MKIVDDRLCRDDGTSYRWLPSPNLYLMEMKPELLIIHYTAGRFQPSLDWLTNPASRVSSHLIISEKGEIVQMVPFNKPAWHCGPSIWGGRTNVNVFSIGIELANMGPLTRDPAGIWRAWNGVPVREADVVRFQETYWEVYKEEQLVVLDRVAETILTAYPAIRAVAGHSEISPGLKTDPGPAFNMETFRAALRGRLSWGEGK